jgi:hypothetical protein
MYRPMAHNHEFAASSNAQMGVVLVMLDGSVTIYADSSTYVYISLDGISFRAADV